MDSTSETKVMIESPLQQKNKIINNNNEFLEHYIWRSCCGMRLDKRVVVFTSQFIIALMIVSFSLFQLSISDDCNHNQLYTGLLTMIVGIFLPSPRVK
jgi:hypothetical protein